MSPPDPLSELLGDSPEFALLRRADTPDVVDVYIGEFTTWPGLADIALPTLAPHGHDRPVHDLLILVPFRQLAERGYACHDDGAPLRASASAPRGTARSVVLAALPTRRSTTPGGSTSGRRLRGHRASRPAARSVGSGFQLRHQADVAARLGDGSARTGLTILVGCCGAGGRTGPCCPSRDRTLVGATPERHVSLRGATLTMNPISGTLRYPATGPTVDGLLRFLGDQKETDELSMVVDEELKMMGRVCPDGGRVVGPRLREMARLAHTEYAISGDSDADVRDILSATLFAPTVVGSPLENACRVVATHERHGRGYYGGVLALIGRAAGGRTLDSAICLRAADIDSSGQLSVDVGASIVRDSEPAAEAAETTAKAAALLSAITGAAPPRSPESVPLVGRAAGTDPRVRAALLARNDHLASFWLAGSTPPVPVLAGRPHRSTPRTASPPCWPISCGPSAPV
jgi:phenazine biosynthesis protein phzE